MSTSLSTVQLHLLNRDYVTATAALVAVKFCFHNSVQSCFILNEIFDMLQQQETLYFWYTNLGLHVLFQITKSNNSCEQEQTCDLTLLHQFLLGVDWEIDIKAGTRIMGKEIMFGLKIRKINEWDWDASWPAAPIHSPSGCMSFNLFLIAEICFCRGTPYW